MSAAGICDVSGDAWLAEQHPPAVALLEGTQGPLDCQVYGWDHSAGSQRGRAVTGNRTGVPRLLSGL